MSFVSKRGKSNVPSVWRVVHENNLRKLYHALSDDHLARVITVQWCVCVSVRVLVLMRLRLSFRWLRSSGAEVVRMAAARMMIALLGGEDSVLEACQEVRNT